MGLFGKLFDKKECDICGGEIGLLGNRKLDDGNLCKECAKKLSPWFEERRHSTVEDIKKQLAYREENKKKVQAFQVTREFAGDTYHVFLDDTKGQFTVATQISVEKNPDIVDLSQVTSCKLNIEQNRTEEQYRDKEGNLKDYNPPRYKYSYRYSIKLGINSPWFDDMDFSLSSSSVDEHDRMKIMDMENVGNQIVAALTGRTYNQQMNGMQGSNMYGQQMNGMQGSNMYGQQMNGMQGNNMYGQQMNGMQGNMYGQQMSGMQGNMYGQQMNGMQGNMYGQQMNGMQGNNMYGQQMNGMQGSNIYGQQMNGMQGNNMYGQQADMQNYGMYNQQMSDMSQRVSSIRCDKCGWVPSNPNNIPKFCPECGDPIDGNDMN
ncbi:MAG: DUF4428 domain-containing protein [Lachnospiraceae bacterium]|nr:DUF4428 domain-containing protein [Robinsoniella sp.]MDY3767477.1 DUF4428 domain-containing protein [Lachnospiraceae bacterium]